MAPPIGFEPMFSEWDSEVLTTRRWGHNKLKIYPKNIATVRKIVKQFAAFFWRLKGGKHCVYMSIVLLFFVSAFSASVQVFCDSGELLHSSLNRLLPYLLSEFCPLQKSRTIRTTMLATGTSDSTENQPLSPISWKRFAESANVV